MPHYLYTHTAHPTSASGKTISTDGFTFTATLNGTLNWVKSTCTINAPTSPYHNQNVGTGINSAAFGDPSPTRRVSNGGGFPPNFTEGWSFSLLFGDASLSGNRGNINAWNAALGTTDEVDWLNNSPSLTWHSPLANESAYTLVVPNDFFVYTDGSITERLGSTLAFHIPVGSLGVWGQNANLPDQISGVSYTDTDEQAAGKILNMGYMLFRGQTQTPFQTLN